MPHLRWRATKEAHYLSWRFHTSGSVKDQNNIFMKTPGEEVIKVMIIDDHRMFNDGLNAMLAPEKSIKVLAQVYDAREARAKVKKLNPDVVLMDFNMPHVDGMALTRLVLSERPDVRILILSMYDEERHIETFREIGAQGYI